MSDSYEKIGELRDQLNDALEALRSIWDLTHPCEPYLRIRAEVVKGLGCAAPSGMEIAQCEADESAGENDSRDRVRGSCFANDAAAEPHALED